MTAPTTQGTTAADAQAELQLVENIYNNIVASLTSTPPGQARSAFDPGTTFVVLEPKGRPIENHDYANPQTTPDSGGSIEAAYKAAVLVDQGLDLNQIASPSKGQITTVYGMVVNATVKPTELPPEQREAMLAAARVLYKDVQDQNFSRSPANYTEEYKAYRKAKKDYDTALAAYTGQYLVFQADPDKKKQWPFVAATYQAPLDDAWQELQDAGAPDIEAAQATLATADANQVAQVFASAKKAFDPTQATLTHNMHDQFYPVILDPSDWCDPDADNWATLEGDAGKYTSTQHADEHSFSASGGFSTGLWSVSADVSHQDQHFHSHTDMSSVSVQYSYEIVHIERPWCNLELFHLPNWGIGGFAVGAISNGTAQGQENSHLPLIPVAFLCLKDIHIKANWSQEDIDFVSQQTSAGGSVGYGPFSLGGQYDESSSDRTFGYEFANGELIIHGVQIVAWICTIVPLAPPIAF